MGSTTCSIGADRAARAALNWKARERRFHFRQVGVSLGSLRGWAQHRGVSLAHPESLRVLAARLGLWIASRGRDRVSIRVDVPCRVKLRNSPGAASPQLWRQARRVAEAVLEVVRVDNTHRSFMEAMLTDVGYWLRKKKYTPRMGGAVIRKRTQRLLRTIWGGPTMELIELVLSDSARRLAISVEP